MRLWAAARGPAARHDFTPTSARGNRPLLTLRPDGPTIHMVYAPRSPPSWPVGLCRSSTAGAGAAMAETLASGAWIRRPRVCAVTHMWLAGRLRRRRLGHAIGTPTPLEVIHGGGRLVDEFASVESDELTRALA